MSTPNSSILWSVPQSLTDAQKLQARTNAGAAAAKKTTTSVPPVSTAIDTIQFFADGVIRGDSTDLGCMAPVPSQSDSGKILKAMWTGSPGKGFAVWDDAPESTPWGVNTNTSVVFTNQPDEADPPVTEPAIDVSGILNYKNNIVNIAVPPNTEKVFCNNNMLRINPPTIQSASDALEFNFWVRIAITRAQDYGISRTQFQVVMPYVGWEIDQYWLQETTINTTFSTKRLKVVENTGSGVSNAPYIITDQQVGPGRYPEKSTLDSYSAPHQVVMNYREEWTANTAEATYDESLNTYRDELHNDFDSNTSYALVDCPAYGYTNYYMIHVTGDMAKLKKFVPYTNA